MARIGKLAKQDLYFFCNCSCLSNILIGIVLWLFIQAFGFHCTGYKYFVLLLWKIPEKTVVMNAIAADAILVAAIVVTVTKNI